MRLFGRILPFVVTLTLAWPVTGQVRRKDEKPAPKIQMAGDHKEEKKVQRKGIVITSTSGEWDKVADEAGQIYVSRGYQGVVPGVRDSSAVPSKTIKPGEPRSVRPVLEWVGFQPFSTYSRVFLQLRGDFRFTVTKPKPERIVIKLAGTDISSTNDQRFLNTREFPTTIDRITIEQSGIEVDSHTVVSIFLKKPVGYLYRQEGDYIFIDVGL